MPFPKLQTEKQLLPITLFLLLLAVLTQLHIMELRGEESRRAMIAIEMFENSNWLIPTMHGWNYYNKPPLWNWILSGSIWLFDSAKEWVIRLPGVLSLLLTAGLIFSTTVKILGRKTAILGSLFFLTCVDLLFFGSILAAEIDPFLTLIIFLQSISIYYGFYEKKSYFFLFAWTMLGIGLLTKGLPSLVFFGLTFLGISIVERSWKWWWHWTQWIGGLLATLLVGGYFYKYHLTGPVDVYLVNLLDDSLQKSATENDFGGIFKQLISFPFDFFKITLPWSLLLLFLVKKNVRKHLFQIPLLRFSVIFLTANIWIYWISPGTHNRYLYPFFPFIGILTAGIFSYLTTQKSVAPNFWKRNTLFQFRFALWFILLLSCARLTYNFTIQPIQATHFKHRILTNALLEKTNNAPIHLMGQIFIQEADPKIGPLLIQLRKTELPPLLSYKIPYYLYLQSETVMTYHQQPQPNTHYLIFKEEFEIQNGKILYTFFEEWTNREMLLVLWN